MLAVATVACRCTRCAMSWRVRDHVIAIDTQLLQDAESMRSALERKSSAVRGFLLTREDRFLDGMREARAQAHGDSRQDPQTGAARSDAFARRDREARGRSTTGGRPRDRRAALRSDGRGGRQGVRGEGRSEARSARHRDPGLHRGRKAAARDVARRVDRVGRIRDEPGDRDRGRRGRAGDPARVRFLRGR